MNYQTIFSIKTQNECQGSDGTNLRYDYELELYTDKRNGNIWFSLVEDEYWNNHRMETNEVHFTPTIDELKQLHEKLGEFLKNNETK